MNIPSNSNNIANNDGGNLNDNGQTILSQLFLQKNMNNLTGINGAGLG
jgi:hypothetical protein